ncbi:MAG: thioredoxin-disulfide reductase [Clostridia bacterium]|nr:thioredoxin-disulfide reductase [Clostridia bacterium]
MIDIAIIGAGPAGLTASIYGARAGLKTVVFEKNFSGGQMVVTSGIENFPGFIDISGSDLALKMDEQARKLGVEFVNSEISNIDKKETHFVLETSKGVYEAKNVIVAMGASPRKLGLESEKRLTGSGVSYCATCDGAFYKGATVAVVGGGNTALEDAEYLSRICNKVYIIHRRDEFRADKVLQDRVLSLSNVETVTNCVTEDILGKFEVEKIKVKNVKTEETKDIDVTGVFVAVGTIPNSKLVSSLVETDESGYIKTDSQMRTSVPGIYAVGDIRNTSLRQVITACSDGAIAVHTIVTKQ